jgi:hypothetical protein
MGTQTLLTPSLIAKEGLRVLKNNLVAGQLVHREYKNEFVKAGATVTIRKPNKFVASDGATRVDQDIAEPSTSITIDKRKHVSWHFSSQDLTLTIEEYSKRYIQPAIGVLADQMDLDTLLLVKDVYNQVGSPGVTPNAFSILGDAATKLDLEAAPKMDRATVLGPAANWAMANALSALNNGQMVTDTIRKGKLGHLAGSDVYASQNIPSWTYGPRGGAPQVDGALQTGTTLNTEAWTAAAAARVAVGDVFTIANVFAVNPVNKASTGQQRQFVVAATSTLASDGAGDLALTISPPITTSGAYQTVNAGPANDALITFVGTASTTYPHNVMFHRDAFALVTVPLELPRGASFKARASHDGVSVRVINDYDIDNDEDIIRLDVMYGVKTLYPELACRIIG